MWIEEWSRDSETDRVIWVNNLDTPGAAWVPSLPDVLAHVESCAGRSLGAGTELPTRPMAPAERAHCLRRGSFGWPVAPVWAALRGRTQQRSSIECSEGVRSAHTAHKHTYQLPSACPACPSALRTIRTHAITQRPFLTVPRAPTSTLHSTPYPSTARNEACEAANASLLSQLSPAPAWLAHSRWPRWPCCCDLMPHAHQCHMPSFPVPRTPTRHGLLAYKLTAPTVSRCPCLSHPLFPSSPPPTVHNGHSRCQYPRRSGEFPVQLFC